MLELIRGTRLYGGHFTIIKNNKYMVEVFIKESVILEAILKLLNKIDPHALFRENSHDDDIEIVINQQHEYNDNLNAMLVMRYQEKEVIFDYDVHLFSGGRNIKVSGSQIRCTKEDLLELI